MEKIIEIISALVGQQIDEKTTISFLIQKTGIGAGDIFDHVYEETGIKIKNKLLPRTVGEIEL